MNIKELVLFIFCCFGLVLGYSQSKTDNLNLLDSFEKVSEDNVFRTEGYFNWGSSIIKGEDGQYHLFYSRWKKEHGFTGWLTHSEIARATSNSPAGPWEYKETVLRGRGAGSWDEITAHNPKIKYFEGKYYLYYISTNIGDKKYTENELEETARTGYSHPNWKILRPNQRTGVAESNSLNGPWVRNNQPLLEPSGPIATLAVNPAIDRGGDGKYYLIVKGDKPNDKNFKRNQAIAISDHPDGPFLISEKPVIDYMDTEDMSLWFDENRNRFYGIFHAHNFIGMVTSQNGMDWEKANSFVVMKKNIEMNDGTAIIPDRMERPFVYHELGVPKVLALAVKKGDESFSVFIPIK